MLREDPQMHCVVKRERDFLVSVLFYERTVHRSTTAHEVVVSADRPLPMAFCTFSKTRSQLGCYYQSFPGSWVYGCELMGYGCGQYSMWRTMQCKCSREVVRGAILSFPF